MGSEPRPSSYKNSPVFIGAIAIRAILQGVIPSNDRAERTDNHLIIKEDLSSAKISIVTDVYIVSSRNILRIIYIHISTNPKSRPAPLQSL